MNQNRPIVAFENVSKVFKKDGLQFTACKEVSFEVYEGENFGIVGESGAGKSTMMALLMRIKEPTAGRIFLHGRDLSALKGSEGREYCKYIQMIFQNPLSAFNPKMTVKELICEPLLNFGLVKKEDVEARARKYLELVSLPGDFVDRYPHELSGGQCQRIAIARALILEPSIIVCDEATSALDVSVQAEIAQTLRNLQKDKNITYIMIGHDIAFIQSMCKRIAIMYEGEIVEVVKSSDLLEAKHPYSQKLIEATILDKDINAAIARVTE